LFPYLTFAYFDFSLVLGFDLLVNQLSSSVHRAWAANPSGDRDRDGCRSGTSGHSYDGSENFLIRISRTQMTKYGRIAGFHIWWIRFSGIALRFSSGLLRREGMCLNHAPQSQDAAFERAPGLRIREK